MNADLVNDNEFGFHDSVGRKTPLQKREPIT